MKLPDKKPAELIFKRFCESYNQRDLKRLLNLFTSNTNMWGTGLDEYRVGLQQVETQLQRDWEQAEKSEIEVVSFIPASDDLTFAAAICQARITINHAQHIFEHLRVTINIEKEQGLWKIAHMHASFPDYRNNIDGSFPVKIS